MTCDFTSLTIFQSYQDDGRVIMNGSFQWDPVNGWKGSRHKRESTRESNPRPLDQQATT